MIYTIFLTELFLAVMFLVNVFLDINFSLLWWWWFEHKLLLSTPTLPILYRTPLTTTGHLPQVALQQIYPAYCLQLGDIAMYVGNYSTRRMTSFRIRSFRETQSIARSITHWATLNLWMTLDIRAHILNSNWKLHHYRHRTINPLYVHRMEWVSPKQGEKGQ